MLAVPRLAAAVGVVAMALCGGVGQAAADDGHGHGWRKWKHHDRGHGHYHHHHYDPRPDVVVIERSYRRSPPRVIYVEPAPVYSRPEINIVFPLRF